MSHHDDEHDLKPTFHEGFKLGEKKTAEELAALDAEDESLAKWKASLGLGPGGSALASAEGPKVTVLSLFLTSATLPPGKTISLDLMDKDHLADLKKNPITIKEGIEYAVGITFKVNHGIISGVRYIQVVKRAGVKVDKLEQMLGSYAPTSDGGPYTKNFTEEESPSGMIARSGTYNVRSRVVDDDGEIYAGNAGCKARELALLRADKSLASITLNGASNLERSGRLRANKRGRRPKWRWR